MRKLLLIILSLGLSQLSIANYLDNWPNDALCSWMENPSPPSYMVEEVKTRDLTCSGGIVIYPPDPNPPDPNPPDPNPPDPNPPDPNPPVVKDQPIRPGWKIAEGSNFWSVDETDPYWQTEEGSKKVKAAKERGSGIKNEANRYAQENPGVDPPTASYYATDPCGEGKQPENASC